MTHDIEVKHSWTVDQWDWPLLRAPNQNGVVGVQDTPYVWELNVDAGSFKPNEVQVRVRGEHILLECEHDFREEEHGPVARTVRRTFSIPDDVDRSTLKADLKPSGILTIFAEKKVII